MDQQIFVYVDLDGATHLVGRLWLHNRKRIESATFRYDEEWLRNPARFPLEPALQMDAAPHHGGKESLWRDWRLGSRSLGTGLDDARRGAARQK